MIDLIQQRVRFYLLDFKERCEILPEKFNKSLRTYSEDELVELFNFAHEYDNKMMEDIFSEAKNNTTR